MTLVEVLNNYREDAGVYLSDVMRWAGVTELEKIREIKNKLDEFVREKWGK